MLTNLNVLSLGNNKIIEEQTLREIITYINKLPNLQGLSLRNNGYDDEDAYKHIS